MAPQFRFCVSADGTRISYATFGSGPALLYGNTPYLSMDAQFAWPEARSYFDALATRTTVVMYDRRGSGASDRDPRDLSVQAEAGDIAAVADAAALDEFTLIADIAAAPCVYYAIEHPDRVRRLVLWCPFAGTHSVQGSAAIFRENWSYGRRVWAGTLYPDGPVSLQRAFNEAIKGSLAPEIAARRFEEAYEGLDALLPRVAAPTLVLQREDMRIHRREEAVRAAALLPDSRLRFVAGVSAGPYPVHEPIVDAVFDFMELSAPPDDVSVPPIARAPGGLRTILFTDIVGHTEMMQRLGDRQGRNVLREHERITRETLKQHGGAEVKTLGDGFLASFGSVTSAMECAIALQRAFSAGGDVGARPASPAPDTSLVPEPIAIRIGLNAGEPIEEDGDLFGATVILASRIAAQAAAGEILVPDTVRGLLSGKQFLFSDRGEFVPKGFDEAVRLYEVRWQP